MSKSVNSAIMPWSSYWTCAALQRVNVKVRVAFPSERIFRKPQSLRCSKASFAPNWWMPTEVYAVAMPSLGPRKRSHCYTLLSPWMGHCPSQHVVFHPPSIAIHILPVVQDLTGQSLIKPSKMSLQGFHYPNFIAALLLQ